LETLIELIPKNDPRDTFFGVVTAKIVSKVCNKSELNTIAQKSPSIFSGSPDNELKNAEEFHSILGLKEKYFYFRSRMSI
jgi:hypothetical protein